MLAVTDVSASASVELRRSTLIVESRNAGSKMTLRPEKRAIAVNTARLLAALNTNESGSLASSGSSRPGGGRSRVRSTRVCRSVLPPREMANLGAEPLPGVLEREVDLPVGRVQLRGELEFDQRFFVALAAGQAASGVEVFLGCLEAGPLQRAAGVPIVRVGADGFRVFDDRAVEVGFAFGLLARAKRGCRWRRQIARWRRDRRPAPAASGWLQRPDDDPAKMTSAPRGMVNANVLSDNPTFSLKLLNRNVCVPCGLTAVRARSWRLDRSTTSCSQS